MVGYIYLDLNVSAVPTQFQPDEAARVGDSASECFLLHPRPVGQSRSPVWPAGRQHTPGNQ